MSDEELAEAEQLLQEEQERDLLYEELLMQNYDFEYGDVIYQEDDMTDENLTKRVTELEEMNADLKQSLDWANERENENVELIVKLKKYAKLS